MSPTSKAGSIPPAPEELHELLAARDADARERAWGRFVGRFSPLILHTARSVIRERDGAMDAYAVALEQLRADDCRRLRRYSEEPGAKFSTWLVVVVRRICLDHLRHRYGRTRSGESTDERAPRRRLVDLVAAPLDEGNDAADPAESGADRLEREQVAGALQVALARLEPRQRLLLVMRFEDERTAREIASLLGYPTPFHVYRAVNTALTDLRKSLAEQGIARLDL